MYIKYRKREKKNSNVISYYFYNCISYRDTDKKVKTKQEYILKFDNADLQSRDYFNYLSMKELRKNDIKTWIMLISKIEFDILEDNDNYL